MRRLLTGYLMAFAFLTPNMAQDNTVKLRVIQTTDVHGSFFPYDFINRKDKPGSLARVSTYVDSLRQIYGKNLILLENGDILQGQPTCYYSNFVNTKLPNLASEVVNFLGYDAQNIGNHDIETGHEVYDKWISELECPVLGANIVREDTRQPYTRPYVMLERDGIRVAVLGLITPAIPNWLNNSLWRGMYFEEMVASARHWMDVIRTQERPDVVIGLFHSGKKGGIVTAEYTEDAAEKVAQEVPGFDLVLFGHDHTRCKETVNSADNKAVLCLNPSSDAHYVADAEITIRLDKGKDSNGKNNRIRSKSVEGDIVDITNQPIDQRFMARFQTQMQAVKDYVDRKVGRITHTIYTRDCYFGSAPFTDLIHDLQLSVTGADISFNAPLSFDASVKAGDVRISDLFNLYKYENQIYVMRLTGEEIRKHLEMSYDLWTNTMHGPEDHIMLLQDLEGQPEDRQRMRFRNLAFNFDSAAGIDYEVDVTKPDGQKVRILRMSNGQPFDERKSYKVAMNSYRGNGGGELLTKGAGIPKEELPKRILYVSPKDQRSYLMEMLQDKKEVTAKAHENWRFVPEEWTKEAIKRDKRLLFGQE